MNALGHHVDQLVRRAGDCQVEQQRVADLVWGLVTQEASLPYAHWQTCRECSEGDPVADRWRFEIQEGISCADLDRVSESLAALEDLEALRENIAAQAARS